MERHKRRTQLVMPSLQLKLILLFTFGGAAVAAIQAVLVHRALDELAALAGSEKPALLEHVPGIVNRCLGTSLTVLLPLFLGIGIAATFRIAGPLLRFESYFRAIAREGYTGPCRLRRGDALQGLCGAVNGAVSRLAREDGGGAGAGETADDRPGAPAALPGKGDGAVARRA